jgi:hypothetical protein
MKEIPDSTIDIISQHINETSNKSSHIPIITVDDDVDTPHYFEIIPFDEIDNSDR